MEKIYGYKEKDVLGLAEYLKERKGESLSSVFEKYAVKSGKAKGTVRNLYYALAKASIESEDVRKKYLGEKPISVGRIVEFSKCEERSLIKQILIAKFEGKSVRSKIMELSNGDGKLALRYQNKFRNAMNNKPRLIAEIVRELKEEGKEIAQIQNEGRSAVGEISEVQLAKVKAEINSLVSRISLKVRKENEYLKNRVAFLESENLKLSSQLYGQVKKPIGIKFFRAQKSEDVIN